MLLFFARFLPCERPVLAHVLAGVQAGRGQEEEEEGEISPFRYLRRGEFRRCRSMKGSHAGEEKGVAPKWLLFLSKKGPKCYKLALTSLQRTFFKAYFEASNATLHHIQHFVINH